MNDAVEPRFLALPTVLWLHRKSLELHGGMAGIRDAGAIESALSSARNAYFYARGDEHDIAAAYVFHIAESQAFLDGNKRTAAACALTFLAGCGVLVPGDQGQFYAAIIAIAKHELDKSGLADVLRKQFPKS